MEFLRIATTIYLFLFSLYHVFTGLISIFFPDFALKFYKSVYGFHPIETQQLKMTLKPWGNLAMVMGIIGFIVLSDLKRYGFILFAFSILLLIRIWYRFTLRKQLISKLNMTPPQNQRMIIIQIIGALLFFLYPLF